MTPEPDDWSPDLTREHLADRDRGGRLAARAILQALTDAHHMTPQMQQFEAAGCMTLSDNQAARRLGINPHSARATRQLVVDRQEAIAWLDDWKSDEPGSLAAHCGLIGLNPAWIARKWRSARESVSRLWWGNKTAGCVGIEEVNHER